MTVYVSASHEDEPEFPCGGVIEMVDVKILYSPLTNLISTGDFEPEIEETVLLITYPDGEKEILTVSKNDGLYTAGNFSARIWEYYDEEEPSYGFVEKTLYIYYDKLWGGYSGESELVYLYLPALEDIPDIINSYFTE